MSDDLQRILLTNLPDFVDDWLLKGTSCGHLIHRLDPNPSDRSKMMIFTKGQENAEEIASTLDNYNLHGSIIRAWYAFIKRPDASNANSSSTEDANCSKHNEIQPDFGKKSSERTLDQHTDKISQRPQSTNNQPAIVSNENGNSHQDRKRRLSATVNSAGRKVLPDRRQDKDSSPRKSRRCRFCRRSSHGTWYCKKTADYYNVGLTIKGKTPPGFHWPATSIVKVEGLHAGPIIEYIEKCHLQMKRMNREEIRIMFAWLTNYSICHACGAAGHQRTDGLCKYLPLDCPVTEEEIAQFRMPFCRRMKGIRNKLSFDRLQQYAHSRNQQFRRWMNATDGRPLKYSDVLEEETSEKPQRQTPTERTDKIEQQNGPMEPGPDEKKIKQEPLDDNEQDSEDEDDEKGVISLRNMIKISRQRSSLMDTPGMAKGTSKSTGGTWASK